VFRELSKYILAIFSFFFFVFISPAVTSAQSIEYHQFGTPGHDVASDIYIDEFGNEFIVGDVSGAFNGQVWIGGRDAFIIKYNSQGIEEWTTQFGTSSDEGVQKVSLDQNGNIYVTGSTGGTFPAQIYSGGNRDVFVAKLDSNGNLVWARQFGTSGTDHGWGIKAHGGEIYISGEFKVAAQPYSDYFLRKYDANGNEKWTIQGGTSLNDYGYDVAVDNNGDVYFGGAYNTNDSFLSKTDSSGNQLWTQYIDTPTGAVRIFSITADVNNNVYVGGQTSSLLTTIPFIGGGYDAFVRKYDSIGNPIWTRQYGTPDAEFLNSLVVNQNNIYVVGRTYGSFPSQVSNGDYDVFVSVFSNTGDYFNTTQFGSLGFDDAVGLQVDLQSKVNLVGYTFGVLNGQTSFGGSDAFIAKISTNSPPTSSTNIDQTVFEGDLVNFDGSLSTDPDGFADIVSFEWDFGDGNFENGENVNHIYLNDGVYNATLVVTDAAGESSDPDTVVVTVNNSAPLVSTISPVDPVLPGVQINVGASFVDAGILDVHTATWDWGDGSPVTVGAVNELLGSGTVTGSHTYLNSDFYTVRLVVSDELEGSILQTMVVQILTPAEAVGDLIDTVTDMNLQNGINNSLDAKLDAAVNALTDLNESNDQAAINTLNAFINAVEAQRGNAITNEQADTLVAAAQAIIDYLSL